MIDCFPFFFNFQEKANAVQYFTLIYIFSVAVLIFFKKWKVRLLNLRVSGFVFRQFCGHTLRKNASVLDK